MSSTQHLEQKILLAEYTLGLLNRQETAHVHGLLGREEEAVATALAWENSLLALTDLLPPVDPSPLLLQRIQTTLGHDTTPALSSLYRKPAVDTPAPASNAGASTAQPSRSVRSNTAKAAHAAHATVAGATHSSAQSAGASSGAAIAAHRPSQQGAGTVPGPNAGAATTAAATTAAASAAAATAAAASGHTASTASPTAASPASAATGNAGATTTLPETTHGDRRARTSAPISTASASAQAVPASGATEPLIQGEIRASADRHGQSPRARPKSDSSAAAGGNIWAWRIASALFAAIALALAVMPAKPVEPPVTIVQVAPTQAAILQAPGQSSTPGWVVTIDPQRNILMQPQVRSDIAADASVQLWTHNKSLPQPRSLGLIDPNQPVTVPASLMGELAPDQIFEMTLEPAGGSPNGSPTGPILFIGRTVTFGTPPAPPQAEAQAGPSTQ